MRFDEDKFDIDEHKKAADAQTREKARVKRVRKQVKRGKLVVAIITIVIFFALFYIAAELGIMQIF
jgi:hypothetical protein